MRQIGRRVEVASPPAVLLLETRGSQLAAEEPFGVLHGGELGWGGWFHGTVSERDARRGWDAETLSIDPRSARLMNCSCSGFEFPVEKKQIQFKQWERTWILFRVAGVRKGETNPHAILTKAEACRM